MWENTQKCHYIDTANAGKNLDLTGYKYIDFILMYCFHLKWKQHSTAYEKS